jgi:glucose 1-dehydrogenase
MDEDGAAIVSGAAKGIGRACAERLAADGYPVVAVDVDGDALDDAVAAVEDAGASAVAVEGDVAAAETAERAVAAARDLAGTVAVLVNNAGVQTVGDFLEVTPAEWDRVHDVDLRGAFLLGQAAARAMVADGVAGRVVNVTSIHDLRPRTGKVPYDTAKAGLWMLTRDMALELADEGIRVNCVAPGAVATPMNDDWLDDPEAVAEVEAGVPLGRLATPEDVAAAVSFLVSGEAAYLTGVRIPVDGGRSLS